MANKSVLVKGYPAHELGGKDYKLKVGDKVVSNFHQNGYLPKLVRKITRIEPDNGCESGARAWADGGEGCPHCSRIEEPINGVDAAWFVPVKLLERKR
jgi:hypothetical protein